MCRGWQKITLQQNDLGTKVDLKGFICICNFTLLLSAPAWYERPLGNQINVCQDDFWDLFTNGTLFLLDDTKNCVTDYYFFFFPFVDLKYRSQRSYNISTIKLHVWTWLLNNIRSEFWTLLLFECHHLLSLLYILFPLSQSPNRIIVMFLFCKLDCSASEHSPSQDFLTVFFF